MNSSADDIIAGQSKYPNDMESYNFLILSLYFYLQRNEFKETSESLFHECKLDSIFKFPQDFKEEPKTEKEKMIKDFIEFFYSNSFFEKNSNFDLLGDFWNSFWGIFANKMHTANQMNNELIFDKERGNISNFSYCEEKMPQLNLNNINNLNKNSNNIDGFGFGGGNNLRTFNNITGISNISNNNLNSDDLGEGIKSSEMNSNTSNINSINNNITNINNINNNSNNNKKNDNNINNINMNNSISSQYQQNKFYDEQKNKIINQNNIKINGNEDIEISSRNSNKNNINSKEAGSIEGDPEEEEEEENDVIKEMDEVNGIKFNKKKSNTNNNIIKSTNNNYYDQIDTFGIDHDAGSGFGGSRQESNINLTGNPNFNGSAGMERIMSAIPLKNEFQPKENNNQNYYEDGME